LGVAGGRPYLVRVNATILKVKPLESEEYVFQRGSQ